MVCRLYFPKVKAIFWANFPPCYNLANTDIQDDIKYQFKSANDWANLEVAKKCDYIAMLRPRLLPVKYTILLG